jgi:hypothetical protein
MRRRALACQGLPTLMKLPKSSDAPGSQVRRNAKLERHWPAGLLVDDHHPLAGTHAQPLPYALPASHPVVARLVRSSHRVAAHRQILAVDAYSPLWTANHASHTGQRPLDLRRACVPSVCHTRVLD